MMIADASETLLFNITVGVVRGVVLYIYALHPWVWIASFLSYVVLLLATITKEKNEILAYLTLSTSN